MELKKNPKADLNRNRGLYFISGLVLVMALIYTALEWKTYDQVNKYDKTLNVEPPLDEEVPLIVLKTPPPPPPPVTPEIIEIAPDEEKIIETVIESTEPDREEPIIDIDEIINVEIDEDVPVSFIVVEDVPVFPGCKNASDKRACFEAMMQKHVKRNFRYPEIAREMGEQGRVSVMFVIQKDGSIGDIKMRGPAKSLEQEAGRIIGKLPKMTPGKQRGRPVKVPFSLPIHFVLQ